MDFQNNGSAVKDMPAKTNNTNGTQNGVAKHQNALPAKAQHGNGKTETKPIAEEKPAEAVEAEKETVLPAIVEVKPVAVLVEEEKMVKPVLSLEAKLKAVNDLHRKSIQRLTLIARIKLLEDFEVALMESNDELESNPYQACKLIIKDDRAREFVTNTPGLIRMVSQFIFDACNTKLDEIESTINFPQA